MNANTDGWGSPNSQSHDYDQHMAVASSSSSSSNRLEGDDIPHIPGSGECLCSACHLSRHVFPRRQDGKIELPNPILVTSNKFGGRHPSVYVRAHTDQTHLRIDAESRENNPRGLTQLSGPGVPASLPESQLSFPPSIRTFKMAEADLVKSERSQTPVPERHAGKERTRQSKKTTSQPKSKRSWPTFSNAPANKIRSSSRSSVGHSDPEFQNPYAEIVSHTATPSSGADGHTSWPDPYENAVETFPQLFDSRIGLGIRGLNPSESSTSSRAISSSSGPDSISGQFNKSSAAISHAHGRKTQNSPSPRNLHLPGRHDQTTLSLPGNERPSTPRDINSIEDPLRVIRFNSCQNPPPSTWIPRNNVDEVVQGRSQIRLSPEQIPTGILRFQDPLMPESFPSSSMAKSRESSSGFQLRWDSDEEKKEEEQSTFRQSTYPSSSTSTKDTSVVQVKWDSERKRRQGYFSQEGVEKSPFRHYNKSSDFDPNP